MHFFTRMNKTDINKRIDCLTMDNDTKASDSYCQLHQFYLDGKTNCSREDLNLTTSRDVDFKEVDQFLCNNLNMTFYSIVQNTIDEFKLECQVLNGT